MVIPLLANQDLTPMLIYTALLDRIVHYVQGRDFSILIFL